MLFSIITTVSMALANPTSEPPRQIVFNHADFEVIDEKVSITFFLNGFEIPSKIIGVTRYPEIGGVVALAGYKRSVYRENAVHEVKSAMLIDDVTVGKGRRSVTFSSARSHLIYRHNGRDVICMFGEPKEKAPQRPQTDCLLDSNGDGLFDQRIQRREGRDEFKTMSSDLSVSVTFNVEQAEFLYNDGYEQQKKPIPGRWVNVGGFDETGGRFIGGWNLPTPSARASILSHGGPAGLTALDRRPPFAADFIFAETDNKVSIFGMEAESVEASYEQLKMRINKGFDPWYE